MAYWWVSQNRTFTQERGGRYLWAPLSNQDGRTNPFYEFMTQVVSGDVIFSYVGENIVAVSTAKGPAYPSPRPEDFPLDKVWKGNGRKIDVSYEDLVTPLNRHDIFVEIQPLLPAKYSPFNSKGKGNQAYFFPLSPSVGRFLLEKIGKLEAIEPSQIIERTLRATTERQATILSRLGQGQFREAVLAAWGGKCCVTGLAVEGLLTASHIKPWSDSDNVERLDRFNGLLLSPSYNAAFDRGYISFDDEGTLILSSLLSLDDVALLGIKATAQLLQIPKESLKYLAYHRQHVLAPSRNSTSLPKQNIIAIVDHKES
jgi:putative restriction endonuclease